MKDVGSFVIGVAMGIMFCCFIMLLCQEPKLCEVVSGDLNHTHIRYGVFVKGSD